MSGFVISLPIVRWTYRNRLNERQIRDGQILFSWCHRETADHSFDAWIGDWWSITMIIWPNVEFLCQMMNAWQITFAGQFRQQIVQIFCDVPDEDKIIGSDSDRGSFEVMKLHHTFCPHSQVPARMRDDSSQQNPIKCHWHFGHLHAETCLEIRRHCMVPKCLFKMRNAIPKSILVMNVQCKFVTICPDGRLFNWHVTWRCSTNQCHFRFQFFVDTFGMAPEQTQRTGMCVYHRCSDRCSSQQSQIFGRTFS